MRLPASTCALGHALLLLLVFVACIFNFKDTLSNNLNPPAINRLLKTPQGRTTPSVVVAEHLSCTSAPSYQTVWHGFREEDVAGMEAAVFSADGRVDDDGYLISVVHALQLTGHSVTIYTSQECAICKTRVLETSAALGVNLKAGQFDVRVFDPNASTVRIFFAFGNKKGPQVNNIGLLGIFVCQFPLDLDAALTDTDLAQLSSFDNVLLNSNFAFKWYNIFISPVLQRLYDQALLIPSIDILHPPASILHDAASPRYNIILLDHFLKSRRSKSHIFAIEIFAKIVNSLPANSQLVLLGQQAQGHDAYLSSLRALVRDMKISERVDFIVSASPEVVAAYLHGALVQWHLTGLEVDINTDPASCEHFGASIIKCMSAGCIPITLHGGPDDIITHGVNGFFVASTQEVLQRTLQIFSAASDEVHSLREAAMLKAQQFSFPSFQERLLLFLTRAAKVRPLRHFLFSAIQTARTCATMETAVSSPFTAMIIEGRNHFALEYVIVNAMSILHRSRRQWSLNVFHTSLNSVLIQRIISTPGLGNTHIHELSTSILEAKGYNKMMNSNEIWRVLGNADKVLVLQPDAFIIRPGIEEFLKYDIARSPSYHAEHWLAANEHILIGTSSAIFSLRSVPIMKNISRLLANNSLSNNKNVDAMSYVKYMNLSECPQPIAYSFCLEVPSPDMHLAIEGPFAIQAAWFHNPLDVVKKLLYQSLLSTVDSGVPTKLGAIRDRSVHKK